METLAYLHLACDYEADFDFGARSNLAGFNRLNWKRTSNQACLGMLSLVLTTSLLGFANEALALQQGDRGARVTTLQNQLRAQGYLYHRATGYYGPVTVDAVKRFQKARGLRTDGIAGSETLRALAGESGGGGGYDGSGSLNQGDRGPAVVRLQRALTQAGYSVDLDGIYGAETAQAVRRFQQDRGLQVDGIAGSATLNALNVDGSPGDYAVTPGNYPATPGNNIRRRYVVVVPGQDYSTLIKVRRSYFPNAQIRPSGKGPYIEAATYRDRSTAERMSDRLRNSGLDARVAYR